MCYLCPSLQGAEFELYMRGKRERDRRCKLLLISKLVTPLLLDWNVNDINK